MTNRKCGTCRFYEAGTQQSHGWCRNPAYPRRDEVALLRPEELGCRSGWGKDFWAARDGEAAAPTILPVSPAERAVDLPLAAEVTLPAIPTIPAAPVADAPPPVTPARRRGFQGPAVAPASAPPQVAATGKETAVNFESSLTGHPELGENGVPIRNTRRSAVAEAHRRALERREQERAAVAERATAALAVTPRTAPVPPAGPTQALTAPRPMPTLQPTVTFTAEPLREGPRQAATMVPEPAAPPPAAPPAEPVDRHISTDRHLSTAEPAAPEAPRAAAVPRSAPAESPPAPETSPLRPAVAPPGAETTAASEPVTPPRYWDQSPGASRFTRMREAVADPSLARGEARTVQPIGRQRTELPPPATNQPVLGGRTIRPLDPAGATNGSARAEEPADSPRTARLTPPSPETRAAFPPPAPPDAAPRQIDDALLRQLETDWRSRALEAHTGQRCGTCRFFQPSEGGRGSCGCAFTAVYHRPVDPQDLGCLNALGSWWAATDDGWLERTERRPRRATPLLDALLREYEAEEEARAGGERRRSAR